MHAILSGAATISRTLGVEDLEDDASALILVDAVLSRGLEALLASDLDSVARARLLEPFCRALDFIP